MHAVRGYSSWAQWLGQSQRLERLTGASACRRRVAVIAIIVMGLFSGIAARLPKDIRADGIRLIRGCFLISLAHGDVLQVLELLIEGSLRQRARTRGCLLYTSDAADE